MTDGISPKVAIPALILALAGVVLAAVGAIVGNDTLVTVGLAVLGASGVTGVAGYRAPAGSVRTHVGPGNDEQLADTPAGPALGIAPPPPT